MTWANVSKVVLVLKNTDGGLAVQKDPIVGNRAHGAVHLVEREAILGCWNRWWFGIAGVGRVSDWYGRICNGDHADSGLGVVVIASLILGTSGTLIDAMAR